MEDLDAENTPGTWAFELKQHYDKFNEFLWKEFNKYCHISNEKGHNNVVEYNKWREYILWDMQRRHTQEVNGEE